MTRVPRTGKQDRSRRAAPSGGEGDMETIFRQSPISTQIFSPDGTTLRVNKAWERLWQTKAEYVVGAYNILKDRQLVETGTMPYVKRGFKGEVVDLPEIKYVPSKTIRGIKAVPYRWTSALMYPIKDAKGRIVRVVLQHQDITDRKLAEESLRESEAKFKAVWESSADAMAISDENGIVLAANKAYFALYGYSEGEVLGKPFHVIFPEEVRKWAQRQYVATFAARRREAPVVAHIRSKDGTDKVVESQYSFFRYAEQDAMLSVVRNISDKIGAQKALEASEERLRLAMNAGKIGAWDWDVTTGRIEWSDRTHEFHGLRQGEFDGSFGMFSGLIHPDDKQRLLAAIKASVETGDPFNIEFRTLWKDGTVRWLSTSGHSMRGKDGSTVRMIGATIDTTERRLLENQKDEFIGIASHELKTPVTSIKVYTDLLERQFRSKGDEQTAEILRRVNSHVDKLTGLIKDLLDVTKIEAGKMRYERKRFDLGALVRGIAEEMQHSTQTHRIRVTASSCFVVGDSERVGQVVTNLISNAIKYSPSADEIKVSVTRGKREAKVTVRDRGIGVPEGMRERIFERFFRAASHKKDTYPGLGLGLYISSEIVRHHKGRIWVESEAGKGSAFSFALPSAGD